jgi:hypothetical protein
MSSQAGHGSEKARGEDCDAGMQVSGVRVCGAARTSNCARLPAGNSDRMVELRMSQLKESFPVGIQARLFKPDDGSPEDRGKTKRAFAFAPLPCHFACLPEE